MTEHEPMLRRAIALAMNGRGAVEPNPMVGCVIVKDGRVIGEGIHARVGEAHAEPTALAACSESPRGTTAYVTLEPCCHTNKRTPPCAPRLIEAGIARVVIGCLDPNPEVDGKGVAMLRAAGIDVVAPVLESEAKQLIAPFISQTRFHRPYVTLKWAQSADGMIAGKSGATRRISNDRAMQLVHQVRARCDAILVGIGTALADDPMLTARLVPPSRQLTRIVLDSRLRLPVTSRLAQSAADIPTTLYFTPDGFAAATPARIRQLLATGVRLVSVEPGSQGSVSIPKLLAHESTCDFSHLLVEPGPTIAKAFFDSGAADRVWVIHSQNALNEPGALAAPALPSRLVKVGELSLDGDTLVEYLDPESDLFFAAVPSADFVLAAQTKSV